MAFVHCSESLLHSLPFSVFPSTHVFYLLSFCFLTILICHGPSWPEFYFLTFPLCIFSMTDAYRISPCKFKRIQSYGSRSSSHDKLPGVCGRSRQVHHKWLCTDILVFPAPHVWKHKSKDYLWWVQSASTCILAFPFFFLIDKRKIGAQWDKNLGRSTNTLSVSWNL